MSSGFPQSTILIKTAFEKKKKDYLITFSLFPKHTQKRSDLVIIYFRNLTNDMFCVNVHTYRHKALSISIKPSQEILHTPYYIITLHSDTQEYYIFQNLSNDKLRLRQYVYF